MQRGVRVPATAWRGEDRDGWPSYDVKAAGLTILAPGPAILAFTAWACITGWGQQGLNNNGPHGFSEIL